MLYRTIQYRNEMNGVGGVFMTDRTMAFVNGQILTADADFHQAEALAIRGGKIVAVGSQTDVEPVIDPDTKIINLHGATLMPGFVDAHAHLELYGTNRLGVDCKAVASIGEMVEKLRARARQTPKGEWIRGWGYNQKSLAEGRHPTREDLDQVSTEHPVIVTRTCGHISTVNSRALEKAGLNECAPDPPGGKRVRREGKLTGVLLEAAHMEMFLRAQYPERELRQALSLASQDFLKQGITSVHDAGGYGNDHFRRLQQGVAAGEIGLRVTSLVGSLHDSPGVVRRALEAGVVTGLGNDRFQLGPAKVFIDGSSSGPTASTRQPYTSAPEDSGILYLQQEELDELMGAAHRKGWQLTAHAIGDRAVDMMVTCIEKQLREHPRTDHRHRIEHAGMVPPDLMARIRRAGIVPIPNPAFVHEFGDGYVTDYGERVHGMFPMRSYMEKGIPAAIGSDSPITTPDPFVGLFAAVTRQSRSGQVIGAGQTIPLTEAIRRYTWYGAYASFDEGKLGSLEPGKRADLIVLDRPLLGTPPERLPETRVDLTMVDGTIRYER